MNLLSYVAGDANVQMVVVVAIMIVVIVLIAVRGHRRSDEFKLRQIQMDHEAQREKRQFDLAFNAVDGKGKNLPAVHRDRD